MFFSTLLPRFSDPLTRSGKFFEKLKANLKRYKVSLGFIYTNLRFIYICIYLHCRGRKIELKKAEAGCGRSQVSSDQACSSLYVCSTCIPTPEKYFKIPQNTNVYIEVGVNTAIIEKSSKFFCFVKTYQLFFNQLIIGARFKDFAN